MRPPPRSIICGANARQQSWTPSTFTSNVCHHASGSAKSSSGPAIPALQTSRSTPPTSAAHRSTSSRFDTSPTSARPSMSAATRSTCPPVRPVTVTCIPAAASSRAMLSPIPRPPPVTSATSANGSADLVERLRILERRQVAGILAEGARLHRAPHDLGGARLRQGGDPHDSLRLERLAERVRDGVGDADVVRLPALARHAEDPRHLPFDRVGHPDRRRLRDDAAADRRRLQLGGPDALAGDVQRVVRAAVQVPVAVFVDRRPVAVRPHTWEAAPVRVEIALAVAPDAASHARPRPPADELAGLAACGWAL